MKKNLIRISAVAFLVCVVFVASGGVALAQATPPASTQVPSGLSCEIFGADPCTGIVNFLLVVISGVMGLLVSLGALMIQIGMTLNSAVYSSQATQSGFGATLAIANLAFILAIIVIAVATILRSDTYGYKKALWRLIAMAILVNFGLVITAPIVGFANGMTNYFVANITHGTSGTDAFVSFSNKLMQGTNAAALQGAVPTGGTNVGGISIAGAVFQTIFSLVFIIIFKGLIALTFLLLGVLLFVRYIYLVVLLIMLPLAWVTWIFPNFSHQFSEWWKKFIHWALFPPAAMFFVWLALNIQTNFANAINAGNSPAAAIGVATGLAMVSGTSGPGILAQLINSIVVIGVMIGGLMAASKLAGGAGSFAVAQGKAVSGYVGRRTQQAAKRVATAPLRTQRAKDWATRMQQNPTNPGLKWANRLSLGLGGWTSHKIGQGLESGAIAGGSKTVDAAADRFKGLTPDQKLNRLTGVELESAAPQRMALLKQIMDEKNIKKLSLDEMDRYFGKDKENSFKRFGQEKLFKDLREKSGLALRDLDKEIDELKVSDPNNKLPDKLSEKKKMLASYIEDNTDDAVEAFTDPDKLEEKRKKAAASGRVPASLEKESLNRLQKDITEGIAQGLSPNNVSSLIKALSKKNNLDGFKARVAIHNTQETKDNLSRNGAILSWNDKQVGKSSLDIDLRDVYGIGRNPNNNQQGEPQVTPANDTGSGSRRTRQVFNEQTRTFEDVPD